MAVNGSQLGQLRPANTTAASIYSPAASIETQITSITICNTSASIANFRIFLDDNGTTYDQTTAMYYDPPGQIQAGDTVTFTDLKWLMNDSTGNLAVRTSVANSLTFTVFGFEKDV